MRSIGATVIIAVLAVGCTSKQFTFRLVDAETGKPLKGVHVYHRKVRTKTPTDKEHVRWFYDVWHFGSTKNDGLFRCSLDDAHWHVLVFRDRRRFAEVRETDHLDQFATISPQQTVVQIGDWPHEGASVCPDGIVTVKLRSFGAHWAWLRSPLNPGNQPTTKPDSD